MTDTLKKFRRLHEEAMNADEPRISLAIFKKTMERLIEHAPVEAEEILQCYEGLLHYNNYLTEEEAKSVCSKLESATSSGARWSCSELFDNLSRHGLVHEESPHFNKWALYTQMNIVASDHEKILTEWSGSNRDKFFTMVYELAKSQLTDKDKPIFIRWYTEID